jgi:DNA-binding response OmpR family regulator
VTIFGREGTGDRGNPLIFQAVEDGLCLAAFSLGGGWPPPVDHMPSAKTRRPFILVIDDEPLVAAVIADTLMLVGYEVETAKNGREALEKIAACSYDLILSDLRMPELDGVGLYRELERHAPRLLQRLIFLSGTTDSAEYIRFLEGTGALVLCKPFDIDTLQRLVRQFLLNEDTPSIGDVEGEEAEYLPLDHPHSEPNCSFCAVRQTPMQHRLWCAIYLLRNCNCGHG